MIERASFRTSPAWLLGLLFTAGLLTLFCVAVFYLLLRGVGIWGVNQPVAWGFDIINFVWWIGIGHAGTFISAIFLLVRQKLRTELARFAETMTLFAVLCAGLFPLFHLGRPWFFYWLFPYPDTMRLWPNFRSPLVWDVFAVSTYLFVSVVFWFLSLVPDLALYRDRSASKWAERAYGIFAMGWTGSSREWKWHQSASVLLAGLAAPLVIAVHSVVGLDFSASMVPGWHSTIFPPYFVAGAIFSGFAMVLTLGLWLRWSLRLEDVITKAHLDLCAKFMLAMSILVSYGYLSEVFFAAFSEDPFEISGALARYFGPYAVISWLMITCNVLVPQLLWSAKIRTSPKILFALALAVNVGMWSERFVIVVTSLNHDFLPSSSHLFIPTVWDWAFFLGSMGLFGTLFLLFVRFLPVLALSEMQKKAVDQKRELTT